MKRHYTVSQYWSPSPSFEDLPATNEKHILTLKRLTLIHTLFRGNRGAWKKYHY